MRLLDPSSVLDREAVWQARLGDWVRLFIAPALLFLAGFFTMDFLLSGIYTWPRTSRVVVLTLTILVLAYEFVYKEQRARFPDWPPEQTLKVLLYSCLIPYAAGSVALVALFRLAA
jgi:hypothetical protein